MSAPKVLIALSTVGGYSPDPLIPLREAGFEVILNPFKRKLTAEEVKDQARGCVGIVAGLEPITEYVLKALPDLRCISRAGIGVDNIDVHCAQSLGIQVCITPEAPIRSVAELTLGLILDLIRQISKADRLIRQEKWDRLKGCQLAGRVIGIAGLGRIGRAVAEMLQKLEATVIGTDPKADARWCVSRDIALYPLSELLGRCDILTLHVSRLTGTKALIGKEELAHMRPDAFLVNMSRGGVVDEQALYESLRAKRLAGAALDVFEQEPYAGPLRELENVVLTAHMGTFTQEARERMERDSIRNLIQSLTSSSPQEAAR